MNFVEFLGHFQKLENNSIVDDYKSVSNEIVQFAKKGKKSLAILDPLRSIFVQGAKSKVMSDETNSFPLNIYWPLRHLYSGINTSFAATYGNWASVYDSVINDQVYVPFSGHAAAQLTRIEALSYPWSPVGGLKKDDILLEIDIVSIV